MSNTFAEPLIEYWAKLKGNIHPDDEAVRALAPKELNFDFPPPAFVGDVRKARDICSEGERRLFKRNQERVRQARLRRSIPQKARQTRTGRPPMDGALLSRTRRAQRVAAVGPRRDC